MAVQDIVLSGFGSSGSASLIVTSGYGSAAVVAGAIEINDVGEWPARRRRKRLIELHNGQFIELVQLALPYLVREYRTRRH